jgi:hypothetical protein
LAIVDIAVGPGNAHMAGDAEAAMSERWEPPDLDKLSRQSVKEWDEMWLQPRYAELLEDAQDFTERSSAVKNPQEKGRFGRAAVILAAATVEAVSNDALATIVDFHGESWPAEHRDDPPWVHFRGRSERVPARLLDRGRIDKKSDYLLDLVWRSSPVPIIADVDRRLAVLAKMRNRIAHMKSLSRPNHMPSITGAQIAHIGKQAAETASDYVWYLEEGLGSMKLPIQVFRG